MKDNSGFADWNPEWDFLDWEKIMEEAGEMNDFLAAVDELANPDPDSAISPEAQAILKPLFQKAGVQIAEEDKRFSEGNITLNFNAFKEFVKTRDLLREMEAAGHVRDIRVKFKKSKSPSDILCVIDDCEIAGDLKNRLADAVSASFAFWPNIRGDNSVELMFRFNRMWVSHDASI